MVDFKLTKAVDAVSKNSIEINTDVYQLAGTGVTISKCVRDSADTIFIDPGNRGNYFSSFSLPTSDTELTTGSTISLLYPELYQLNTDRFVLINIAKENLNEFIDGRSVVLRFIYSSDLIPVTLYSSTYTGDKASKYGETSPLVGDNIAYLFSDDFNTPYSGLTVNELGKIVSRSGFTSWNPTEQFKDRPGAVSYREVQSNTRCINSDRRQKVYYSNYVQPGYPAQLGEAIKFNNSSDSGGFLLFDTDSTHSFRVGDNITIEFDTYYNYNTASTITNITSNSILTNIPYSITLNGKTGSIYKGSEGVYYNYDIPLGFVCLDRGFIVITHKDLVDNFAFSLAGTNGFYQDGTLVSGFGELPLDNIYWTGNTNFYVSYNKIKTENKTSVSCSALLNEFYISNNNTWNRFVAQNPLCNTPNVQITEAGFYNGLGELIGISKFSQPISKGQGDILTFDFNIDM
jgi:hypothetical protein